VESYWESWHTEDYPGDYASFLKDVPATPIGSCSGVNYVSIAFGDFSGGFQGLDNKDMNIVLDGIEAIHYMGAKVKMAYGGATYGMSHFINKTIDADKFVQSVKVLKDYYGIDGVDLDIESGGAQAELQTHLIRSLRESCGPDFHISYTIPALTYPLEPWKTVILRAHQYMDAINIMAYDYYWNGYAYSMDIEGLLNLGVPKSKIVIGVMPGRHDASTEYTSIEDAKDVAEDVALQGLGGVMTWDINRDTDQRMGYIRGDDNLYQTGQGRGTYLDAISNTLNCEKLPRKKVEKAPRKLPPPRRNYQVYKEDRPKPRLHVAKTSFQEVPRNSQPPVERVTVNPNKKRISDQVFDTYAEKIFKAWNLWSRR